jgi:hypothetical protein
MNSEDYRSCYFVLTQDIDLDDELNADAMFDRNYNTISMFSGVFDGQGFAIQNMSFDASDIKSTDDVDIMETAGTALFHSLGSGGVIKNLKVENVDINTPYDNASALIYRVEAGASVHNVSVSGSISGQDASGCGNNKLWHNQRLCYEW